MQTGTEYLLKERAHLGIVPHYFSRSLYAQYCFDAVLTLAYALNQTLIGNLTAIDNVVCVWLTLYVIRTLKGD